MPVNIFAVPGRLQVQHELGLAVGKVLQENKVKVDALRDPKKSDTESLDWTCSGEKLLVCSRDGILKMWRSDRLMEERAWTGGSWTFVEAHPTDPFIFSAVSWDGRLKIIDTRNPAAAVEADLKKSHGDKFDKLIHVTWNLDGKSLAIISRSDVVHTYSIETTTGSSCSSIQPGCEVYGALFDSKNRLWVATGGSPGKILIYPTAGESPIEVVAHSFITACMSRSRDNRFITTGGSDALVALWDAHTVSCLKTFPDSLSPVTCVSSNFDNSLISWGSGGIGNRDGEPVLSTAGLETGVHYSSFQVSAPVSRVKWHPTSNSLAFSMQSGPSVDSTVNIISFPTSG